MLPAKIDDPCLGVNSYEAYLKTEHWADLKNKAFRAYGEGCEICGTGFMRQVHHLRYRRSWFETEVQDLMVLCKKHHELVHELYALPHDRDKIIQKHKVVPKPVVLDETIVCRIDCGTSKRRRKALNRRKVATCMRCLGLGSFKGTECEACQGGGLVAP